MKTLYSMFAALVLLLSTSTWAQYQTFISRITDQVTLSAPGNETDRLFVGTRSADIIVIEVNSAIEIISIAYVLESGEKEFVRSFTPTNGKVTSRTPLRLLPKKGLPISFVELRWKFSEQTKKKSVRFEVIELELINN